jgi:hypothetical protein
MKITLRQLRSLIREMAMGRIAKKMAHKEPDFSSLEGWDELSKENQNNIIVGTKDDFASVRKYFGSKSWEEKAKGTYKRIAPEIWIIPRTSFVGARDNKVLSFDEALPIIEQTDFMPEEVQELLSKGGSLWIVDAATVQKDFWPSPWNTLHGVFDSQINSDPIIGAFAKRIISQISNIISKYADINNLPMYEMYATLVTNMTMKSAREKSLSWRDENDIMAELATQAIQKGYIELSFDDKKFDSEFGWRHEDELNEEQYKEYLKKFNESIIQIKESINAMNIHLQWDTFISGKILNIIAS